MTSLDKTLDKSSSLDTKGEILLEEEDKIYKSLDGPTGGGLGSAAIHKNQSNMSFNMSMDFGDSFAVADDDDDLADLCADAAQFQKLDSDKPSNKNKQQTMRTASRQPALDLIGEHDEDEEEEDN